MSGFHVKHRGTFCVWLRATNTRHDPGPTGERVSAGGTSPVNLIRKGRLEVTRSLAVVVPPDREVSQLPILEQYALEELR